MENIFLRDNGKGPIKGPWMECFPRLWTAAKHLGFLELL